ncbi:hypothetical protein DFQ26_008911 [Actinomortierella ambigua]|nr:hypothetical protein DFQ26_008911 [Actinomortierella ambigua]
MRSLASGGILPKQPSLFSNSFLSTHNDNVASAPSSATPVAALGSKSTPRNPTVEDLLLNASERRKQRGTPAAESFRWSDLVPESRSSLSSDANNSHMQGFSHSQCRRNHNHNNNHKAAKSETLSHTVDRPPFPRFNCDQRPSSLSSNPNPEDLLSNLDVATFAQMLKAAAEISRFLPAARDDENRIAHLWQTQRMLEGRVNATTNPAWSAQHAARYQYDPPWFSPRNASPDQSPSSSVLAAEVHQQQQQQQPEPSALRMCHATDQDSVHRLFGFVDTLSEQADSVSEPSDASDSLPSYSNAKVSYQTQSSSSPSSPGREIPSKNVKEHGETALGAASEHFLKKLAAARQEREMFDAVARQATAAYRTYLGTTANTAGSTSEGSNHSHEGHPAPSASVEDKGHVPDRYARHSSIIFRSSMKGYEVKYNPKLFYYHDAHGHAWNHYGTLIPGVIGAPLSAEDQARMAELDLMRSEDGLKFFYNRRSYCSVEPAVMEIFGTSTAKMNIDGTPRQPLDEDEDSVEQGEKKSTNIAGDDNKAEEDEEPLKQHHRRYLAPQVLLATDNEPPFLQTSKNNDSLKPVYDHRAVSDAPSPAGNDPWPTMSSPLNHLTPPALPPPRPPRATALPDNSQPTDPLLFTSPIWGMPFSNTLVSSPLQTAITSRVSTTPARPLKNRFRYRPDPPLHLRDQALGNRENLFPVVNPPITVEESVFAERPCPLGLSKTAAAAVTAAAASAAQNPQITPVPASLNGDGSNSHSQAGSLPHLPQWHPTLLTSSISSSVENLALSSWYRIGRANTQSSCPPHEQQVQPEQQRQQEQNIQGHCHTHATPQAECPWPAPWQQQLWEEQHQQFLQQSFQQSFQQYWDQHWQSFQHQCLQALLLHVEGQRRHQLPPRSPPPPESSLTPSAPAKPSSPSLAPQATTTQTAQRLVADSTDGSTGIAENVGSSTHHALYTLFPSPPAKTTATEGRPDYHLDDRRQQPTPDSNDHRTFLPFYVLTIPADTWYHQPVLVDSEESMQHALQQVAGWPAGRK